MTKKQIKIRIFVLFMVGILLAFVYMGMDAEKVVIGNIVLILIILSVGKAALDLYKIVEAATFKKE